MRPLPTTLITVDCCLQCNSDASKDDQYFGWFIATTCADDPRAERLVTSRIIPRLRARPRLLYQIWKGARPRIELRTPGGIILGYRPGFEIDRPRVQRVMERIVRGLHFHHQEEQLAPELKVRPFLLNPVMNADVKAQIICFKLHGLPDAPFSYRFGVFEEDRRVEAWAFMFYGRTLLFTMTEPASTPAVRT